MRINLKQAEDADFVEDADDLLDVDVDFEGPRSQCRSITERQHRRAEVRPRFHDDIRHRHYVLILLARTMQQKHHMTKKYYQQNPSVELNEEHEQQESTLRLRSHRSRPSGRHLTSAER